jgi:hypothetical protein
MKKNEEYDRDKKLIKEVNKEKIVNFESILDDTKNLDDKRKMLWKEIYYNAQEDRERASLLLTGAMMVMEQTQTAHTMVGTIMTKYIERMSKANDQILKLAELIQNAGSKSEEEEEELSEEDIYSKLKDIGN